MRFTRLAIAAFASVLVSAPALAADQTPVSTYGDTDAVAVFFEMNTPEVRQQVLVRFSNPVQVGDKILMGRYIVEHDTDRMARGEPCTHIYEFDSRKLVAAFHCTHLTRPRAEKPTVSITSRPMLIGAMKEFQFAGETEAHGVPAR